MNVLSVTRQLKFYGGFAFRGDRRPSAIEWRPFGTATFWLPRLTFDGHCLRLVVLDPSDVRAARQFVRQLRPVDPRPCEACPACLDRVDLPDQASWFANVDKTLGLFRDEVLEKVVLARRATFRFDGPLCPLTLTEKLSTGTSSCYRFCFQVDPQTAFLGATPERLFVRQGTRLESEVMAGTRRRSQDPAEDQRLAQELLESAKDQLEHDIVRKSIRQRLHPCVQSLSVDTRASILRLPRKQHLYSYVQGLLKPDVTDGELMERLHPTPAVGGYPTDNALAEIEQLEPFERGWYAAPIGWIGARCGRVCRGHSFRAGARRPAVAFIRAQGSCPGRRPKRNGTRSNTRLAIFSTSSVTRRSTMVEPEPTAELNQRWAGKLVQACLSAGMDHFFLAPGSRCAPLTLAVAECAAARVIQHFDERGLAFACLGYGRASGRSGVFICTSGTAVANAWPAVVEASMDNVPMLLLTADRPAELRETGANQTIDQQQIFGRYARFFFDLPCSDGGTPERTAAAVIRQAALHAATGPAHVNCMFREPLVSGARPDTAPVAAPVAPPIDRPFAPIGGKCPQPWRAATRW